MVYLWYQVPMITEILQYKCRAKSHVNQKAPSFVVLLLLKQYSLHSATSTQSASACRNTQFQLGGLFTQRGSGRRWVARGNATGLDQRTAAEFICCRPYYHRTDLVAAKSLTSYSRDSSRAYYRTWLVHRPTCRRIRLLCLVVDRLAWVHFIEAARRGSL